MFDGSFAGNMVWPTITLTPPLLLLAVWSIAIKGYALWVSARATQKWWFIALLVINTAGILEVVYLVWFAPANRLTNFFRSSKVSAPAEHSSSPQA
jgi:hypothetical protein